MKFTFSFDDENSVVNMEYYVAEDENSKMKVITKFEQFLKGCGIELDGKLKVESPYQSIWETYPYGNDPAAGLDLSNSTFSSMIDDHIDLTSAFPDMMSVDLDIPKTCGSTGCGNCGCKSNAN